MAEAFTNAFVQVKVLEIQSQLSRCLNCTCSIDGPVCNVLPNANFSFCMRIPGTLATRYSTKRIELVMLP